MNKIFLDLDGTLIDARKRLFELYKRLSGSELSFETYWQHKRAKYSNEWLLENFEKFSVSRIESFKREWMGLIEQREYLHLDLLFPETKEILDLIGAKADLILITGRQSYTNLIWELEHLNILGFFKEVLSTANKVPKEDLIRGYTKSFSSEDFIVGDTGIEIMAGKSLGITTISVLSGFRNKQVLEGYHPDFIIEGISELPLIVNQTKN